VPERPDHPDHERLAAFEAGDIDRRERSDVEAHLARCPSCAEVVASVERARSGLALLQEPNLPAGLHDRLAAAVETEAAQTLADRPASRFGRRAALFVRPASRSRRRAAPEVLRPTPWYRRPAAWGAAAALLLAALVVPFLDRSGDDFTAGGGSGDAAGGGTQEAAAGPAAIPVFNVPGEVSAGTVSARLATDRQAKAALDAAADTRRGQTTTGAGPGAVTPSEQERQEGTHAARSSTPTPRAGTADLQACLPAAAAAADPALRPLVPAFYIEGTYQGRAATVLVTTSGARPGRVDLWVFPRNDCSSQPLATERVR
jgi:Putative zinc-finger